MITGRLCRAYRSRKSAKEMLNSRGSGEGGGTPEPRATIASGPVADAPRRFSLCAALSLGLLVLGALWFSEISTSEFFEAGACTSVRRASLHLSCTNTDCAQMLNMLEVVCSESMPDPRAVSSVAACSLLSTPVSLCIEGGRRSWRLKQAQQPPTRRRGLVRDRPRVSHGCREQLELAGDLLKLCGHLPLPLPQLCHLGRTPRHARSARTAVLCCGRRKRRGQLVLERVAYLTELDGVAIDVDILVAGRQLARDEGARAHGAVA